MLSESIRYNIIGALVFRDNLFRLVGPTNVVVFEVNMSGLCRNDGGCCEFDSRIVVFQHDGGRVLGVTEVLGELSVMDEGFGCSGEGDIFTFGRAKRDSFFHAGVREKGGCVRMFSSDSDSVGRVRAAVRVGIVGHVGSGTELDTVGIVSFVRGEGRAVVRGSFEVAKDMELF